MAWIGTTPVFIRRHGTARAGHKGRPGRHPADADHWCHVAIELDGTQGDPGKLMAGAHDGPYAAHVGRPRTSQQHGAQDSSEERRVGKEWCTTWRSRG